MKKIAFENILDFKKITPSFYYFILIVLLIAITDVIFGVINEQYEAAFLGIITTFSLFLVPVWLFRNNLRLYAWLLLPIVLFVPITFACFLFYNVPINDSIVILAINTNAHEAYELLKGFTFPFLIIMLIVGFAYYMLLKKVPQKISNKQGLTISIFSLLIILTFPLYNGNQPTYGQKLRARFYTVYPTTLIYALGVVYNQAQLLESTEDQRNSFHFNANQVPPITQKQVYILVLGESARFDHFGINGYKRNTSPKLGQRNNLLSFKNVTSGAYITEYAVPLIITGVGADNFQQHYKQTSIVSAFKEAGFNTYWISNQIDIGHINVHVVEADQKELLLTDFKATKNTRTDRDLLAALDKVLKEPGDKKFIIFHHLGSHYDYSARYPDSYDFFKPSNKTVFSQANDAKMKDVIINSYDNSILYTDNTIDSIITLTKEQNAVSSVFYISDHGENLFDDKQGLSQHAYAKPSKHIAHVPFFIWYSDALQQAKPEQIKNLEANIGKKASSQNVFFTYTNLVGINFNGNDVLKSLGSAKFKEAPQRILGGASIVYDCDSLSK